MDSVVKRTLRVHIRKFGSCVVRMKEKGELLVRRRTRGGGERRGAYRRRPTRRTSNLRKEPTVIYSSQAELEKERKLSEDVNARQNAEHFRRKYQLDKKDTEHLRSVGGKVTLPRELSKLVRPKSQCKDKVFSLLSAFQSLSFSAGGQDIHTHPHTHRVPLEPCKVM